VDGIEYESAAASKNVETLQDMSFHFCWRRVVQDGSGVTTSSPKYNILAEFIL